MFRSVWAAVCMGVGAAAALILIFHPVSSPVQTPPKEPVSQSVSRPEPASLPKPEPSSPASHAVPAPLSGYWMREQNGKLAIFRNGETSPMQVLDFQIALLPEDDRKALRAGIFVTDDKALAQLIEDYTS